MKYEFWMANLMPYIGGKTAEYLHQICGSAQEFYELKEDSMEKIPGLPKKWIPYVVASKKRFSLESYDRFLEQGYSFYTKEMKTFPKRLQYVDGGPFYLFVKGKLPEEERRAVAIVGARGCSNYGKAMAKNLGKLLSDAGVEVISGLAAGIDAHGHLGALQGRGNTYGVLGCGVDICYPNSSRPIFSEIPNRGGLISEFPNQTKPKTMYFPMRNRIISGLSDYVVVVEARRKSGSLITADFALEQGKEIYAFPGRIIDELSGGTNHLIEQGAGVITSFDSFFKMLNLTSEKCTSISKKNKNSLEKEESMVYSNLDLLPKSLEEIMQTTNLEIQKISEALLMLQNKGMAEETFKNYYRRTF